MGRRYSRLKYGLKLIRNLSDVDTPTDAPAGSALAEYQKFVKGDKTITIDRATDSLPGKILKVAINPFGVPLAPENQVTVSFSDRVNTDSPIAAVKAACNHSEAGADDEVVRNFVPAKAIVSIPATATTTETSGVTGLRYKTKKAKSYTYPYGQATGKLHESVVRADITAAITAGSDTATVTFNSEEL